MEIYENQLESSNTSEDADGHVTIPHDNASSNHTSEDADGHVTISHDNASSNSTSNRVEELVEKFVRADNAEENFFESAENFVRTDNAKTSKLLSLKKRMVM